MPRKAKDKSVLDILPPDQSVSNGIRGRKKKTVLDTPVEQLIPEPTPGEQLKQTIHEQEQDYANSLKTETAEPGIVTPTQNVKMDMDNVALLKEEGDKLTSQYYQASDVQRQEIANGLHGGFYPNSQAFNVVVEGLRKLQENQSDLMKEMQALRSNPPHIYPSPAQDMASTNLYRSPPKPLKVELPSTNEARVFYQSQDTFPDQKQRHVVTTPVQQSYPITPTPNETQFATNFRYQGRQPTVMESNNTPSQHTSTADQVMW